MKYIFAILIFTNLNAIAQELRMPGQVLDDKRTPIENVSVGVVGDNSFALTDANGLFLLILKSSFRPAQPITLRFSKTGYKTITKHTSVSSVVLSTSLIKQKTNNHTPTTTNNGIKPKDSLPRQSNDGTIVGDNSHNIIGNGNNVGVNGDLNINTEKHLLDLQKVEILNFIENLKKQKNSTTNSFQLSLTSNSNGRTFSNELVEFLKSKGYTFKGFGLVSFGNPTHVVINIMNDTINILVDQI
ncbi:carboxypeptidase regulatory-like domain-containing protein [Mucilaginibacter sp. ZT4R22]|uniref:Carboxypeptidase regulatory-like domain-containing protein n=1 Tax=Mucilaginibacter pankratovii TaxID=2772110 RepID=A0ABR7WQ17_9SPHI|nr:carboxypeptidase-like regulatory domain-containing protein [Mucilaginibacter pankratovii]MBD1364423.1 carboxypeptidase regulatory-like domain-containing protein [Mucilaginibacter pankratovii]